MPYNDKYFFEFDTLKTANKVTKYYRVVFSKLEDIAVTYDLVQLTPSNSPFVLSYRSPEDNAFSPIKTSSAEINILYPYDAGAGVPQPEIFFDATDEVTWLVRLYELTSNGAVSTLKWQGYLLDSDVQYEWQDAYYYRMTATDNLAVLKDVKYSSFVEFKAPLYDPMAGTSVVDFIIDLVNNTGNTLDYKFAWNLYNDGIEITLDELFVSKYAGIDWESLKPKNIYPILEELLTSLGCIIYQDNNDATWTILNVTEIGTRTDNEVPFLKYDSAGNYLTIGVINLNSSINKGETDLVWRDKNQIVTLNKPIGVVQFLHKYIPKNLLKNYSFQDDLSYTGWDDSPVPLTISVDNDAYRKTGINYDKYLLDVFSSEPTSGGLTTSQYIEQFIDITGTQIPFANGVTTFSIYLSFQSYGFASIGSTGEGFNYQIISLNSILNDNYYSTAIPVNGYPDGYWTNDTQGRIAVFPNTLTAGAIGFQNNRLFTTPYFIGDDGIKLRFLKYRYDSGVAVNGDYSIDNLRFSLCPRPYNVLESLGFNAVKDPRLVTKTIKTMFHGGQYDYDWYVFEGALGLKDINDKLYCNALWDRHWEQHDESSENYLQAIIAKSILSFYRSTSRKFTGNIWGEEISYPKYFEIQGAENTGINTDIANAFQARILLDIGECENVYCGSNYLNEFNFSDAKFLMIEATFDYQQSTTAVNLHEDLTSDIEINIEAGIGGGINGNGIFPNYGSTSDNGQTDVVTPS